MSRETRGFKSRAGKAAVRHTVVGSPHREMAEAFVAEVFKRRYGALVSAFAPNIMLLERNGCIAAAAGWRAAGEKRLFLENYLDDPVETALTRLVGKPVDRRGIVEVGNLASDVRGGGAEVILGLAGHLYGLGFEWVAFTATAELMGIMRRLGLEPQELAAADPKRLGSEALLWGSYYEASPVVVAGRIRQALDRDGGFL